MRARSKLATYRYAHESVASTKQNHPPPCFLGCPCSMTAIVDLPSAMPPMHRRCPPGTHLDEDVLRVPVALRCEQVEDGAAHHTSLVELVVQQVQYHLHAQGRVPSNYQLCGQKRSNTYWHLTWRDLT